MMQHIIIYIRLKSCFKYITQNMLWDTIKTGKQLQD
jgi:hypothetical protein